MRERPKPREQSTDYVLDVLYVRYYFLNLTGISDTLCSVLTPDWGWASAAPDLQLENLFLTFTK